MVGAPVDVQKMGMGMGELSMSQIRIRYVILYHGCAVSCPFERWTWVFPSLRKVEEQRICKE